MVLHDLHHPIKPFDLIREFQHIQFEKIS